VKITVIIDGKPFEVEVGNLYERPVIAVVDGMELEVWPEGEEPFKAKPPTQNHSTSNETKQTPTNGSGMESVVAPISGLIFLIKVQAGEEVVAGQELCILEAMKMKNIIRSPRAGRVRKVNVHNGQQVPEGDVLVTFEPETRHTQQP